LGLYSNISNVDYHSGQGLGSSHLKSLLRSPMHYKRSIENPFKETEAMRMGNAVHCAVLESESFREMYVAVPEGDKRSKAVKAAWAEIDGDGKIPLSLEDFNSIQGMARSIHAHPFAGRWLSDGIAEQSGYWMQHVEVDELQTDILCKCRP